MAEDCFVGIHEASRMLGVSEATLRYWTDEGKLKAFITPGGHRRFLRSELKEFIGQNRKVADIKDLVVALENSAPLHHNIGLTSIETNSWFSELDQEAKDELAELGRQLLSLIIKYIRESAKRKTTIKFIRNLGYEHGKMLARLEMSLPDSIEVFTLHRDPIMKAVVNFMNGKHTTTKRMVEVMPLIAHAMDEALITLILAHQEYVGNSTSKSIGGSIE